MGDINGILLVDKPMDFTSFDVVGKLRGILKTKKIGHAGTLDPMATGVLPIFIGKSTRAIPFLEDHNKRYTATFKLGTVTDTQDITGEIIETHNINVTTHQIEKTIMEFQGNISQIPPMYSAVKIDGKRLYDLARKGIEVERKPRDINIEFINILENNLSENIFTIDVMCSKGTYIRTLCHDIGQKLGCGAVLTQLRRTEACGYKIDNCIGFDEIQQNVDTENFDMIKPIQTAFEYLPKLYLSQSHTNLICNGVKLSFNQLSYTNLDIDHNILYSGYSESGLFIGLCFGDAENKILRSKRLFAERV